jgi:hypothetical protein
MISGCCVLACVGLLTSPAQSACTVYELVNFDVYNFTDYEVDGFLLVLEDIYCSQIDRIWEGY